MTVIRTTPEAHMQLQQPLDHRSNVQFISNINYFLLCYILVLIITDYN